MADSIKSNRLKNNRQTYVMSEETKQGSYYRITPPNDHNYLFATIADWGSGGQTTSPFSIAYEKGGSILFIIVGTIEPVAVYINYWYYD